MFSSHSKSINNIIKGGEMRIFVLVLCLIALMAIPASAREFSCDGPLGAILNKCIAKPDDPVAIRSILGAKFDAPNLIRFTDNLTLGIEGGKDLYTNIFQETGYWVEDDKGYFGYIKVTWTGTLKDFRK